MKATFQMSDLGLLKYYFGLEVNQTPGGITVSQSAYAVNILEAAGHDELQSKSSSHGAAPQAQQVKHRGTNRYHRVQEDHQVTKVSCEFTTDLSFSIGYICRFMAAPTNEHLGAMKRVLCYITGSIDYGCCYRRRNGEAKMVGFSDSDVARDIDTRRSTTGVLFFNGNNLVTRQSQKKKVAALSSCEAEYITAATTTCQGVWLARLLAELRGEESTAFNLKIDNQSAIMLSKNLVFHDHSKHIDTKFHLFAIASRRTGWMSSSSAHMIGLRTF
jgi:hypothetical protein